MKISKLFLTLICLMLCLAIAISLSSCEKTNIENEQYFDPDDPDEIGYAAFDNDGDSDGDGLTERASTFKITSVTSDDSLPAFRPDGKKQKYGKRRIVSTVTDTRFYIRGFGFKAETDSSNVFITVKNVEIDGLLKSWSDTLIVVDIAKLENPLYINNTFSIKFKVQRANDKAGKANVTRVKSKTCISDIKAGFSKCQKIDSLAILIRKQIGITTPLGGFENCETKDYYPTKGDVLTQNAGGYKRLGVVLNTPSKKEDEYFNIKYLVQKDECTVNQSDQLGMKRNVGGWLIRDDKVFLNSKSGATLDLITRYRR